MTLSWAALFFALEWAIRVVMLFVVPRRRSPSSAMAWLLLISFLPWVGLVMYMLLGRYHLPRRRFELHAKTLSKIESRASSDKGERGHIVRPCVDRALLPLVKLAESLGHFPILGGNRVEWYADNDDFVAHLIEDIDKAARFVHVMSYIYGSDETARQVSHALCRASKRGVECRVLVDAVGSQRMLKTVGVELARSGVEVCEALPVGLFRRRMARIDLRNHRKLVIIDGETAYTGSHNIIDATYGRRDIRWYDLTGRLAGPVVVDLEEVFAADWYFETEEVLDDPRYLESAPARGDVAVQVLPSGPNYPIENYQRLIVAALYAAQEHVVMTTPYFVPDEGLSEAIQAAALRDVRIELILPKVSDQILVAAASRAYYEELLDAGVEVYLYTPGLLHAKTMVVDDSFGLMGTGNFDIRSFALNFELNLLLYSTEVTSALRLRQEEYRAQSEKLVREKWVTRPVVQRHFQNIARLLSPVL